MPLISEEDTQASLGFRPAGHPEGLTVTRDAWSPPVSDGGRPWADTMGQQGTPTSREMWRSAFELENPVVAASRRLTESSDYGPADPAHNPLETIKGTPVEEYRDRFLTSRNAVETEAIKARIEREIENRRVVAESGLPGMGAVLVASMLSPTVLLPFGTVYKGYRAGSAALQTAARTAAWAGAGVAIDEAVLQSVQETRTLNESLLNVGGGIVLGGLLGAGASRFASSRLAKASRAIDQDLATIRALKEQTPIGRFDPDEPPFGRPGMAAAADAGAAAARPVQENKIAGAFGLEKAFRRFNPLSRMMGSENRAARDAATRLAEQPMMLEQNKMGIPTGPEGGSVEARIKIDGDLALYRMQESMHRAFSEHRFQEPDAWFSKSRAWIEGNGPGKLSYGDFKREVTRALREETAERGIQHPIPEVKAAAEAIRKDVFDAFKNEGLKLGLFPKDADFLAGYVTRRYDVAKILTEHTKFRDILVDWLTKGQAKAQRELAELEAQLRTKQGEATASAPEIGRLKAEIEALKQRWSVDPGDVDAHLGMWSHAVRRNPKKPETLSEWVKREGGIRDTGKDVQHMMGGRKAAGRLVDNKNGHALDDMALRAWEQGFFGGRAERPTINEFLDLLDDDVGAGRSVRDADQDALTDYDMAQEFRKDLEASGALGTTSEDRARRLITAWLREQTALERNVRADLAEDRARLAGLREQLARATNDDERALIQSEIDKLTDQIGDVQSAVDGFAARRGPSPEMLREMLDNGLAYRRPDIDVEEELADVHSRYADLIPEGARLAVPSSIEPSVHGAEYVGMTFRTSDGEVHASIAVDQAFASRALYIPEFDLVVSGNITGGSQRRSIGGRVEERVDDGGVVSGIFHEVVHAFWRRLDIVSRARLAVHGDSLQILDMQLGTFLRAIGNPNHHGPLAVETLRDIYTQMYRNSPDLQDRLAQEAVAHMQELHYAGFLSDADVAPVLDDLMRMRGGAESRSLTGGGDPLFALDASTGQSMRRDLDALGYYSQALEAAKSWNQKKGTPEQALMWLKKSGVKDAEIEATGMRAFLDGKSSVTRDEVVGHLEANRVKLTESRYQGEYSQDRADTEQFLDDETITEFGLETGQPARPAKWSNYSLDPDNPTYRETVLHLPAEQKSAASKAVAWMEARGLDPIGEWGYVDPQNYVEAAEARGAPKFTDDHVKSFQSGHFPEPNIIGHMMTSMTTHQGKPVYTIDQIQSDWGQRIRDDGVKDDAKTEALRTAQANAREALAQHWPDIVKVMMWPKGTAVSEQTVLHVRDMNSVSYNMAKPETRAAIDDFRLKSAELRTAEGAVSGNPLVNTTDQWVNTTLRRAIRQAAEADAEYIAIPSGETVLSYNPGDTHGMGEFYGKIVPKNLRNLLSKIDKASPDPQHIDTLDSPSGKTGLGKGFTLFPLTDKVKQSVMTEGQPLFALAGRRAEGANLSARNVAERLAERGKSMKDIFRQTGWFQGQDGFWRFEIDDSKAAFKEAGFNGGAGTAKPPATQTRGFWSWLTGRSKPIGGEDVKKLMKELPAWAKGKDIRVVRGAQIGEVLDHETLFRHYPFLRTMKTSILVGKSIPPDKIGGQISFRREGNKIIYSGIRVIAHDMDKAMDTLLHEVQHYIQIKEGWPAGSAPKPLPRLDPNTDARPRAYSPNTEEGIGVRWRDDIYNYRKREWEQSLSARSTAERAVRDIRVGNEAGIDLQTAQSDLRRALHIDSDAYRKDAGEAEANMTSDRRRMTEEERRNSLPLDPSARTFDTSRPMTFPEAADVIAEREARTAAMEAEWAKPVEVAKGLSVSRISENRLSFLFDDGTEAFGVEMAPTVGMAELHVTVDGLEALRDVPLTEQKRLVQAALDYTTKRYNVSTYPELSNTLDEDFAFWHAVRPDLTVADIRSVFPTLEPHFVKKFGEGTTLESVDAGSGFYIHTADGEMHGSWSDAAGEWEHLVPEWSLAFKEAARRGVSGAPKGLDHEVWRASNQPLFAVRAGDEAQAPRTGRPEVSPELWNMAKQIGDTLGVEPPQATGKTFDDDIALLESFLRKVEAASQKAGKSAADDMQSILSKIDEVKRFAGADEQELQDIANETISTITGAPAGRMVNPFDSQFLEGKSGPLQARTLKIPDLHVSDKGHAFADFLDDDIERIASGYVRSIAPDVALAREFGDINLKETLRQIQEDADRRSAEVPDGPETKRIQDEARRAQNDLIGMTKRLRGTYNVGQDPSDWGPWMARRVKELNVLRLMGSVVAASISDPMKLLMTHGFRNNADLFSTLATNFKGAKLSVQQAKELSAGLELVMSKAGQLWDAFDDFGGYSKFDHAMQGATRKFGRLTLMDPWNATLKQLSGAMTVNRVLRASVDLANGRISARNRTSLAKSGIGPEMALEIAAQYQKHGGMHGRLFLANAGEWDKTDMAQRAAQALRAAVRREADVAIVTPGQERPLWTSGTVGSVLAQFRTFQLVTIQRTLIPAMQEANAAVIVGIAGMIGLGMMSERLKQIIHGKEQKHGPMTVGDWLYAGIANGGILGWIGDVDQTMHKVTRGNISAARFLFGKDKPISRFASQNVAGSLLGPTFGAGEDVARMIGGAASGDISQGDVRAMRRLLPYQNLFWISRALRSGEEGMMEALGVPERRRN